MELVLFGWMMGLFTAGVINRFLFARFLVSASAIRAELLAIATEQRAIATELEATNDN